MQRRPPHPAVRLLRTYAWRYRWSYLAGTAFLWLTNDLTARIPLELGAAVDALTGGGAVGRHAAAIAAMGAAIVVVRTLSRVLIFNPGRDLEYRLRQDLYAHLLRLPPRFHATRRVGDLVSRASNDIRLVRAMVGFGGLQVLNVTFAVTITGWRMLALSPRLTAVVLLPVLLGLAVVYRGIQRLFSLQLRNQEQLADIADHVLGTIQGMATVQGFGAEPAFEAGLERRNRAWFGTGIRLAMIRALVLPFLGLAGGLAVMTLLWVGGRQVLEGTLTVGQLAAFAALLAALMPPMRSLGWMLAVFQRGRASLERIYEVLDAPAERPEGERGEILASGRGPALELDGLEFAYPARPDLTVLRGISADIPAGAVVGLYGRTGSGKTTLLRILARLEEPPRGTVRVDGVDLLELDLDAWRERVVLVEQRPFLFSATLAENIALEPDPDPERLRWAVRAAALEPDLPALPEGLATVVGERGVMLSGGQRQRTALARALYRGGDLVLLDDVMSAVDHSTEERLVRTVRELRTAAGRPTVVVASHRLSVLRHTDLVLVLDRGRLVDVGGHEELIARPGPYREAWALQQLGEDEAVAEAG